MGISDLPTSSFVIVLLLLLMTLLPEVETGPEEKRDNGKRQAQGEVYLYGIETGVGIRLSAPRIVRLEDIGTHERLNRREVAVSFKCVLIYHNVRSKRPKGMDSAYAVPTQAYRQKIATHRYERSRQEEQSHKGDDLH